jgi:hypothetical protein
MKHLLIFPNKLGITVKVMVSNDLHSSVGLEFRRQDRIHPLVLGSEKRDVVRICKVGSEGKVKDFNGVMSGRGSFHITMKVVPVLLIGELGVLFLVFLDPAFKRFSWSRASLCKTMSVVKNVGQGNVGSESEQAPAIEIISQYQHAIKNSRALVAKVVEHCNESSDHEFVSMRNVQGVGKCSCSVEFVVLERFNIFGGHGNKIMDGIVSILFEACMDGMKGVSCNEKDVSNVSELCSVLSCIGWCNKRNNMNWGD